MLIFRLIQPEYIKMRLKSSWSKILYLIMKTIIDLSKNVTIKQNILFNLSSMIILFKFQEY